MRVNLIELLAERTITHPTHIEAVTWRSDELSIVVSGYRWWKPHYAADAMDGRIRLIFSGLVDGCIRPDEFSLSEDEALEDFRLERVADVPWAQPMDQSVFCSAPIPKPLALYVRLSDFLSRAGAFREARHYLNQADQIASFVKMAASTGFLLCRGPNCVRSLICTELDAQGVPHNVLRTAADMTADFLVTIGNSAFLCCQAEAEMDLN